MNRRDVKDVGGTGREDRPGLLRNRAGSVTILILFLLTALMSMILVFLQESKEVAVKGTVRELSVVWVESILGEYDRNLLDRYGIFAFYGNPDRIQDKMDDYARSSFDGKRYITYDGSLVQTDGYEITQPESFRKQAVTAGRYAAVGKLAGKFAEKPGKIQAYKAGQTCIKEGEELWRDLPSDKLQGQLSVAAIKALFKGELSPGKVLKKGTDVYFENRYLRRYFNDEVEEAVADDSVLRGELEYIICGKHSDEENRKAIKIRIIAMRFAANSAYILSDPTMNAQTLSAAEVLTPGPLAPATQKAIQLAWAAAEARNDYYLLINHRKVPLTKDASSWAIDLKKIIRGGLKEQSDPKFNSKVGYVDPHNTHGYVYGDYLEMLCSIMDSDKKLLRAMDLIQVNMRHKYYGEFRMEDYCVGLDCILSVNGEDYEISKSYDPRKEG